LTTSGPNFWASVKSNRHSVRKRRDVSNEHLAGRLEVLKYYMETLGKRYPSISELMQTEMVMIEDEIELRAAGKSKPSAVKAPEPSQEWEDMASLEALAETVQLED
jgi:hypothetical protein